MESNESGYEAELLEVFRRCDRSGKGYLDSDGLTQLCQMLHLEDDTETLMSRLGEARGISFASFKNALLSLLSSTKRQPDRTNSPDREVSPKYVYGQKKYGRRSRPESTDYENGDNFPPGNAEEGDNDAFQPESNSSGDDNGKPESCSTNLESRYESVEITNGIMTPESGTPEKDIERGCSELRMVWDKMGNDGFLNKNQLAMVCSSVGMDTLADQVVEQVFSKLGRDEDGRVGFDEFLELVRGWSPPSSPPPTLPLSPPYHSPTHHKGAKSNDLELWDSAGLSSSRLLQELQTARTLLEALTEERDKLRSDLADANQRASLLAQEVDEHHARIERATHNKVKQLELKYGEEIKQIEKQALMEKENLVSANQKLEETIAKQLEQINKLNAEVQTLKSEFKDLEKENKALGEKLKDSETSKLDLERQIKYFTSLHQRIIELETADESIEKLKERISSLQSENTELRDRNDELTTQLESSASRACHRREGSWGCGEWCSSVGGGGTKRRGKSPDWPESRLRHRLGKVRRCSTEYDLFTATTHDSQLLQHESPLKKSDNSESGLETDLETVTGSSPTLSNGSFEHAGDCQEIEIEKLKMYVSQLEEQLHKYQLKEWGEVKSPLSDDESLNYPSIITVKSEPNQHLSSQTISHGSDAMSCKSLSGLNLEFRETVSTGIQTEPWECRTTACTPMIPTNEGLMMDVKEETETTVPDAAQISHTPDQTTMEIHSSLISTNFNDGIEWESSETILPPSRVATSPQSHPSLDFQPFQPVSKFNFVLHNSFNKNELNLDPTIECKLPNNGFTSLNVSSESKCLSCKNILDVDKQALEQLKVENRTLSERCKEFENSLELMRVEYEKTEDYWASKLDEERRLFEEDQMQSDEKFGELQMKIQEYAELFAGETNKKSTLPPIEEKDYLEKQFTDLEEEYDSFRQKAEDELNEKDEEILKLRKAIAELKSQIMDKREAESQTEEISHNSLSDISDTSDADDQETTREEECYKCTSRLNRELRRKRKLKSRLVVECQALELHKRQLLDQITALKSSSQVHLSNTQVWSALTSKLRYQESICQTLENSFRLQQKHTEQALHKAYERHKFDLLNVQNTLRMTREKLQNQSAITRKLLERVAEADTLVKELFVENAHLVGEIASLQSNSPERIGPISI